MKGEAIYYRAVHKHIVQGPNNPPFCGGLSLSNGVAWVSIAASCNNDTDWTISIQIENLTGAGEYSLSDFSNSAVYTVYGNDTRDYSSLNTGKGKITITKDDRANTILSGTFEFEGVDNDEPGKIVKVTSGRFDIKYQ